MDIITSQEAKAQGLTRYYTGKPCLRRHLNERLVSNKTCCQCILERSQTPESKERDAAYYAANTERYAAQQAEYRQANAERVAAYQAEYRKLNAERFAAYQAEYRQANAERVAAYQAEYRKLNAARREAYRKANPHLRNALSAKRRATKLQATPRWADFEAIKEVYRLCAEKTKDTGIKHAVDHIYPLISTEVCGLHVAANLQIITALENSSKKNRMPTPEQIPSDLE